MKIKNLRNNINDLIMKKFERNMHKVEKGISNKIHFNIYSKVTDRATYKLNLFRMSERCKKDLKHETR